MTDVVQYTTGSDVPATLPPEESPEGLTLNKDLPDFVNLAGLMCDEMGFTEILFCEGAEIMTRNNYWGRVYRIQYCIP